MRGRSKSDRERQQKRVEEILRIRIDGAQAWDVRDYIRERERGESPADEPLHIHQEPAAADPWRLADDDKPMTDAQIGKLIEAADALILASVQGDLAQLVARQIMQRRTLYARAVNNGELSVALACLRDEASLLGLYDGTATKRTIHETPQARIARITQALEGPSPGESPESAEPGGAAPGRNALEPGTAQNRPDSV